MTEVQTVDQSPLAASKARRAGKRREQAYSVLLPTLTFAVFAVLWQYAANKFDNFLIPNFTATFGALRDILLEGDVVWKALWTTNSALIVGYGLAVAIGVPVGLATARSRLLSNV